MNFKKIPIMGAVLAAIAASLCCIIPISITILGIGSAAFSGVIQPYRPILIGVSISLLGIAFLMVYRKSMAKASRSMDACVDT